MAAVLVRTDNFIYTAEHRPIAQERVLDHLESLIEVTSGWSWPTCLFKTGLLFDEPDQLAKKALNLG